MNTRGSHIFGVGDKFTVQFKLREVGEVYFIAEVVCADDYYCDFGGVQWQIIFHGPLRYSVGVRKESVEMMREIMKYRVNAGLFIISEDSVLGVKQYCREIIYENCKQWRAKDTSAASETPEEVVSHLLCSAFDFLIACQRFIR